VDRDLDEVAREDTGGADRRTVRSGIGDGQTGTGGQSATGGSGDGDCLRDTRHQDLLIGWGRHRVCSV
jgi:hypothetical protein